MLSALAGRLYNERRRFVFVSVLAFLAGVLFYANAEHYVYGVHVSLVIGAVYAGVVGTCAMLVCLLFPSLRFMIEAIAVSRVFLASSTLAFPDLGTLVLTNPFAMATLVVLGGYLISRVLHGNFVKDTGKTGMFDMPVAFKRRPARLKGSAWQHRLVSWLDDTPTVSA